jgi:hypothetical protein
MNNYFETMNNNMNDDDYYNTFSDGEYEDFAPYDYDDYDYDYEIPTIDDFARRGPRAPLPINTKSLASQKKCEEDKIKLEELKVEKEMFKDYTSNFLKTRQIQEDAIMPWGSKLSDELVGFLKVHTSMIVEKVAAKVKEETIEKPAEESIVRTALCKSVLKNGVFTPIEGQCPFYKGNCRFAHSLEELSFRTCTFEGRCNLIHVNYNSGYVRNANKRKTCGFIHRSVENVKGYFNRIGVKVDIPKTFKPNIISKRPVSAKAVVTGHDITFFDFCVEEKPKKKAVVVVKQNIKPDVKQDGQHVFKSDVTAMSVLNKVCEEPSASAVFVKTSPPPAPAPKASSPKWISVGTKKKKVKRDETTSATKNAICRHLGRCNRGAKCGWAHSIRELRACRFRDKCRKVRRISNEVYENTEDRKCCFHHPGETLNSNYNRVHKK